MPKLTSIRDSLKISGFGEIEGNWQPDPSEPKLRGRCMLNWSPG